MSITSLVINSTVMRGGLANPTSVPLIAPAAASVTTRSEVPATTPDRRTALQNLSQRTNLPGIRGVVNALIQSDKYGTPLSQSLRVLSAEFREERMLRAEEKAARLPAMMTVPMIIFILPPLFIVLIGPAILRVIDALSKFT